MRRGCLSAACQFSSAGTGRHQRKDFNEIDHFTSTLARLGDLITKMGEGGEQSEHFDPNADPRERRRLRYQYRELIAETHKNKHDLIKPDNPGLHKLLDKADELFAGVKQTREAVLDSNFFVLASSLGAQQAHQLQTHFVTFDRDVFAEKLVTFMGGRNIVERDNEDEEEGARSPSQAQAQLHQLDWRKLGQKVSKCFKKIPTLDFMLGPLSMAPPAVRQPRNTRKQKQDKPDPSQKVRPSQLDKVEERSETTTKEVDRVYQVLFDVCHPNGEDEEAEVVDLFSFVINPDSFGQTIENIFHLSFLIMRGRAGISVHDDLGVPVVYPMTPFEESRDQPTPRKQVILSLTMDEWKEIIEVFNIEKPMIPTREELNNRGSSNNGDNPDED